MSITKLLTKGCNRTLFTTPSHSQNALFNKEINQFYKYDYSEIEGFDNLSSPKNSIMMAQGKVSNILSSKQTFFITQGATTGVLAAMKTIIKPADKVLVARNCHKSVYNGLILTAGYVNWFMPEIDEDWGIYTYIDADKLNSILQLEQYKAFIMTSPTYEGINSDIEKISEICKNNNVYLIVDEAHGALYNFSDNLPKTAIKSGADVSINSLHKTAGAINQTALLNISNNIDIEPEYFQNSLNLIQTTSPSYPILSNIECCVNYLNSKDGKNEINNLLSEIDKFKQELKKYDVEFYENENHDPTKILLRKKGISGYNLSNILFEQYNIEDEMANKSSILYLTGIGTTKQKLNILKNALKKVETDSNYEYEKTSFQPFPLTKLQPVDAFNRKYKFVNKNESLLKISSSTILPYPPGIGLLYPGEAIQEWHLEYLSDNVEIVV